MNIEQRDLAYGRKTLCVSIDTESGSATFRFGTREPQWLHRRKEGETTTIFRRGEELLQSKAISLGMPICMTFDTASTNLKAWVLAHKDDLGFDKVEPEDASAYRITVTKWYGLK